LRRAGNNWINDNLTKNQRLQVVPIIFMDGEFVCETWQEFEVRAIDTIRQRMTARHRYLRAKRPEWYHRYSNTQKGLSLGQR
jgi:hypothetical protein